jgi:hypothetical protein
MTVHGEVVKRISLHCPLHLGLVASGLLALGGFGGAFLC